VRDLDELRELTARLRDAAARLRDASLSAEEAAAAADWPLPALQVAPEPTRATVPLEKVAPIAVPEPPERRGVVIEAPFPKTGLARVPTWFLLSGISVIALALRMVDLNRLGLNTDEAVYAGQGASIAGATSWSSRGEYQLTTAAATWAALFEIALWGPRMVMSARARFRTHVPPAVVTVVCQAAGRAVRNPEGYASETAGQYTYRYGDATTSGVYLTEDEHKILRRISRRSCWSISRKRGILLTTPA